MNKVRKILEYLDISEKYRAGEKIDSSSVVEEESLEDGNRFVVIKRDRSELAGQQDPFYMAIIDKSDKIIIPLGTHPVQWGALKFYANRIEGKTTKQLKKDFSYMI